MKNTKKRMDSRAKEGPAIHSFSPYLTSADDGPSSEYTMGLLEGLKERNVKATFFVLGKSVEENADILNKMKDDGHLIGNHTFNHVRLTEVGHEEFVEEIIATNETIYKVTGEYPNFIRPPFGAWSKELEEELNMIPVLWTVDPLDWCTEDVDGIVQKVVTKTKENGIILLHDNYKTSVTAALRIIDLLQAEGYEFVTVEELIMD